VLHLHDKERTGQSRGKPIVTAVMREFHMAGKYSANELQASVASSLVAAFLESDLDVASAAELFGDKPRDAWATSVKQAQNIRNLKGAAVIPLPAGAKLQGFAPNRPNAAFEAFMLAVLRHIAAGLNIPYELLVKDFSKTNYSSARAALLEAWRYFNGRRRWLVDYWLKPIYELWLEEAVNLGEIEAPDFYQNRYAYTRCRFIFGGKGWVDPVKEAQAAAIRILNGFSTLEQECAEQGLDFEEVLDQLQLENKMRADRGLATVADAAKFAATVPVAPDKGEDGKPSDTTQEQQA
jgi:lambda family phage portal protein